MKIENLTCEYTGGGIYIICGQADGEWFITENEDNYLDIVDGDYHAIEWDGSDKDVNWYKEHYLYTPSQRKKKEIFRCIYSELKKTIANRYLFDTLESNWAYW